MIRSVTRSIVLFRSLVPQAILFLIVGTFCSGCAMWDYRARMDEVQKDYYAGNPQGALLRLDEAVELNDDDQPLYLMERALVRQRLGDFKGAQQDLMKADERLEIMDFADDTMENVAQYTISESWSDYRGQPYEKILINTLNILNFLAEGDLNAARIEARRAGQMYDYQVEVEEGYDFKNSLTMMLFGLVFDISQRPNNAYVAYKKSYELVQSSFLRPRLLHTARAINHSDLHRWVEEFGEQPPPLAEGQGSVLIVVMNGRAPVRVEKEVQVPAPLLNYSHEGVTLEALGKKTIRFPDLVRRSHSYRSAMVRIGGEDEFQLLRAMDIESQAMARFEAQRPQLIAAAASRLLVRYIASAAITSFIEHELNQQDQSLSDWERILMESLFDAALSSLDVPDTRCWHLLPAEVLVGLKSLPAGDHRVRVRMSGNGTLDLEEGVTVQEGKLSLVQFYVTQ